MTNFTHVTWRPSSLTRVACCVLCALLLLGTNSFSSRNDTVQAQSIDELNAEKTALSEKQSALEAQRDETAATLEAQQAQNELLLSQIETQSQKISVHETLIAEYDAKISEKTARIAQQDTQIAELETKVTELFHLLRDRLRALSKTNTASTGLQIILDSKSYTDYLISFKMSERISAYDQEMMKDIEDSIVSLTTVRNQNKTDKAALEIERAQIEIERTEMEADKAELQVLYAEKDSLAQTMSQNVEYLDTQIQNIHAQQAHLQGVIDDVMEQIRQEEEARRQEEERRRQEEEAARLEAERLEAEKQENQTPEEPDDSQTSEEGDTSDEPDQPQPPEDGDAPDTEEPDVDEDNGGEDNSDEGDDDNGGYEPPKLNGSMVWPAPTCKLITSSYGYRPEFKSNHYGVDIACYGSALGQPIVAAADGTVRYSNRYDEWGGGFGYFLTIDHGYDELGRRILTVYAHCNEVIAYAGQTVSAGETIAYIGNTGDSYGAHLHFEVQVDGYATDPTGGYLPMDGVEIYG